VADEPHSWRGSQFIAAAFGLHDHDAMQITDVGDKLVARFRAMGSACEVVAEDAAPEEFRQVADLVAREAWRIERKFSRYGHSGVLALLRRRAGRRVRLDAEAAGLIELAALWYRRSDGLFDITSGALQRLWHFEDGTAPPDAAAVARALAHVGFHRLHWEPPVLSLPPGVELDLGGLGKEYAVDRAHDLVAARLAAPALVNFGGDLRVTHVPRQGHWRIGLETAEGSRAGGNVIALTSGALATSGDAHRHIDRDGVRYGHILDPRTGWPVPQAPRAVSVAAATCIESGLLAKVALLHGVGATGYLAAAGVRSWITPALQVH
jgi:thiamine biosynthesis lipoprotein